jgi:hypothetical protein
MLRQEGKQLTKSLLTVTLGEGGGRKNTVLHCKDQNQSKLQLNEHYWIQFSPARSN